jgi:hypothetical protein
MLLLPRVKGILALSVMSEYCNAVEKFLDILSSPARAQCIMPVQDWVHISTGKWLFIFPFPKKRENES